MESTNVSLCYPKSLVGGKILPVSKLDHVLYKGEKPKVTYYCPSTGDLFSSDSYKLAVSNAVNKVYPGTDHKPFSLYPDTDVKVAYVSLDNSVRSNGAGHSLNSSGRLDKICEIVKKIDADIVFFSEACRKSDISWVRMRCKITEATGLVFCTESANNFSKDSMSFGVAMFAKSEILPKIEFMQAHKLLEVDATIGCWGSGCVVAQLTSGTVLVGCHFPIDFKRSGKDNLVAKAMQSLVALVSSYNVKAYGFGDMNTISGVMSDSVDEVLNVTEWKLTKDCYTFLASYYDETPSMDGIGGELTDEVIATL